MNFKKYSKYIGRFFAWLLLVFCSLIAKFLPLRLLYSFAKAIALLGFLFIGRHRRIALESLNIAFDKEKSPCQIWSIARECFIDMVKSAIEIVYLSERPALIKKYITFRGQEHLESALKRGKGVILVSAHFGNFPLMVVRMNLEGYKTYAIMRTLRDKRTERFFIKRRDQLGVETIFTHPRKECVGNTLRFLRNNKIIFIPLDQNFGQAGGVFVDFFGKLAATAVGPVVLAQRTQAALLPCFIIRQLDNSHVISFEPPLFMEGVPNTQDAIKQKVQVLTAIIESYIRRYPAQWSWIHRRWKSKQKESEA